jgi:hypothetical protein
MREYKNVERMNEVKRKHVLLVLSTVMYVCDKCVDKKKTPLSESASELYRPSDRRLSAK